ncbi:MAG: hypothetical protein ABSC05_14845 [Candidatus Solibacter sp.]|jgi:hypothetical protein
MKAAAGALALLAWFAWEAPCAEIQTLNITTLQGEGSFNDIRRKVAAELVVEIRNEAERPVADAEVVFSAPYSGAGGLFADGQRTCTVRSGSDGRAVAARFRPNFVEGRFAIHVTASYGGKTANAVIWQSNTLASQQKGGGYKKLLLLGLAGGAIAGGVVMATSRTGTSASTAAPAPIPTSVSIGTLTVGPPH